MSQNVCSFCGLYVPCKCDKSQPLSGAAPAPQLSHFEQQEKEAVERIYKRFGTLAAFYKYIAEHPEALATAPVAVPAQDLCICGEEMYLPNGDLHLCKKAAPLPQEPQCDDCEKGIKLQSDGHHIVRTALGLTAYRCKKLRAGETRTEAMAADKWLEENGFIQYPEGIRHDGYLKESLPEIMELYASSRIAQLARECEHHAEISRQSQFAELDANKRAETYKDALARAYEKHELTLSIINSQFDELKKRAETAEAALTQAQAEIEREKFSNENPLGWRRVRLNAYEDRAIKAEAEVTKLMEALEPYMEENCELTTNANWQRAKRVYEQVKEKI